MDLDGSALRDMYSSWAFQDEPEGYDVVFSFDTTGSMYGVLAEVRRKIHETCEILLRDIPNIRIAIVAHGDYCDRGNLIKCVDFSRNPHQICGFIDKVKPTFGGDYPEAYEYVLKRVKSLSWNPAHSKALVMIGDAPPHPPSYTDQEIYWRDEIFELYRFMGVKIYGVQAYGSYFESKAFYQEISRRTGGVFLELRQFSYITEMFKALCYRQWSIEALKKFREQLVNEKRMDSGLQQMFLKLEMELSPPPPGRELEGISWWKVEHDNEYLHYEYDKHYKKFVLYNGDKPKRGTLKKSKFEVKDLYETNPKNLVSASTRVGSSVMDAPLISAAKAREIYEKNLAKPSSVQFVLKMVKPGIYEMVEASGAEDEVAPPEDTENPEDWKPIEQPGQPPKPPPKSAKDANLRLTIDEKRSFALARLIRDLKEVQRYPLHNIAALPIEDDFFTWHINMAGPVGTPYDGIIFHMVMKFPDEYPRKPPGLMLCTNLYHPNVFGKWVCLDMLEIGGWSKIQEQDKLFTGWSSAYSVSSILCQLQAFLFEGNYDSPMFVKDATRRAQLYKCKDCGHNDWNGIYPPLPSIPPPVFQRNQEEFTKKRKPKKKKPEVGPLIEQEPEKTILLPTSLDSLRRGMELPGIVTSIKGNAGAFVDVGMPVDAFLPITSMKQGFVRNVTDVVNQGDSITVYVDEVDPVNKKLTVTLFSELLWKDYLNQDKIMIEDLAVGMRRFGKIVNIKPAGCTVDIGAQGKTLHWKIGRVTAFLFAGAIRDIYGKGWELDGVIKDGGIFEFEITELSIKDQNIKLKIIPYVNEEANELMKDDYVIDEIEMPDGLENSYWRLLSSEVAYNIMKYLNPVEIARLGATCRYLYKLAADGISYHWERNEMVCFHSKRTFVDDTLGVGLNLEHKLNGKLAYITCTYDLISYSAFMQEKIRKAAYKEKFTHWMPLYINPAHGKESILLAEEQISYICAGTYGVFKPEMVLEVIPKLMNTMVVSVMSGKLYASIMALEGYCAFHHLFLAFVFKYPELRNKIDEIIRNFLQNEFNRHKKNVSALGEWLPLLTVTETYSWKDVAKSYLLEMFDRNVLWTLKKHPKLRVPSTTRLDGEIRLRSTFEATIVSNHLLMFHVYFLKKVARPDGLTLSQVKELLDSRYGRPTYGMKDRLMKECKRIRKVHEWNTFFKKIYIPAPKETTIIAWLNRSLENSARKKYHNPNDFLPSVIKAKKEEEKGTKEKLDKIHNPKKAKKQALVIEDDLDMKEKKLDKSRRGWY